MSALLHDDLVRVYELPEEGPGGFRFGGGVPVPFLEVDWFNALPTAGSAIPGYPKPPDPRTDPDVWQEKLTEFLLVKRYVQPARKYLVLCLHRSFVFEGEVDATK